MENFSLTTVACKFLTECLSNSVLLFSHENLINMEECVTALLERFDEQTGCSNSSCKIRLCSMEQAQETIEALYELSPNARCSAALRKLSRILKSPTSSPYGRKLICRIGSEPVCDTCFAALYLISIQKLTRLKTYAKQGKTTYGTEPRRFVGNQYRTPASMEQSVQQLHAFFDYIIKNHDKSSASPPVVLLLTHRKEGAADLLVLPPNFTAKSFYTTYCDYCTSRVDVPVNYQKFIDTWHADYKQIVLKVQLKPTLPPPRVFFGKTTPLTTTKPTPPPRQPADNAVTNGK